MRDTQLLVVLGAGALLSGCYFDYTAADAGDPAEPSDGSTSPLADAKVTTADPDAKITPIDAAVPDAAVPDAPPPDAPSADAWVPYDPQYSLLSETGLYVDITTGELNPDLIEFEPVHQLWSDSAFKRRWILLPPGTEIDTSDMNHWRFPNGTKVWKQFSRITPDGEVLLETRLVERTGPSYQDTYFMSFEWRPECDDADSANDGQCDAEARPLGASNVRGTSHDIPPSEGFTNDRCIECHGGERHRVLGFGAVQLSHAVAPVTCAANPGSTCPTLTSLAAAGRLTAPPPPGTQYPVPGNALDRAAIGYLHANCGHCHNPGPFNATGCYATTGGDASDGVEGFHARVYVQDSDPTETAAFTTTFGIDACGVELVEWTDSQNQPPITMRGVPGDSSRSAVHYRVSNRGAGVQMPPIATELVDTVGADIVGDWIDSVALGPACN